MSAGAAGEAEDAAVSEERIDIAIDELVFCFLPNLPFERNSAWVRGSFGWAIMLGTPSFASPRRSLGEL